jgi:hypothetical protein
MKPWRWLFLPAVLALGLAAGTLIGFAADTETTVTSIAAVTEFDTSITFDITTESVATTVYRTVVPDPPDHSVKAADAFQFGSFYCRTREAEITEDVVSERGLEEKLVSLGERFGASAQAARAITEACNLILPRPTG